MSLEASMSFGISRESQNSDDTGLSMISQKSYAPTPSNSYVNSTISEVYSKNKANETHDVDQTNQAFLEIQQEKGSELFV